MCAQIAELIAAAGALLDINEALRAATMHDQAEKVRLLSADLGGTARGMILSASSRPGDPVEALALLGQAVELDGADSLLVAQVALALGVNNGRQAAYDR